MDGEVQLFDQGVATGDVLPWLIADMCIAHDFSYL